MGQPLRISEVDIDLDLSPAGPLDATPAGDASGAELDAKRRWVSVALAAQALGHTERRVRQRLAAGELAGRRIGRQWQVDALASPAISIAAGLEISVAREGDPLAGLSNTQRQGAHRRLEAVQAWQRSLAERPDHIPVGQWRRHWLAIWNRTGASRQRVTERSLIRWCRQLRDDGIAGLVDNRGGLRQRADVSDPAWELFSGLYLDQAQPDVARCYEIVAAHAQAEEWNWPSLRTVQRWARDRLDPKLAMLGRDPKRFRDRAIPYIERDASLIHANQLWVADHRRFDVLIPFCDAESKRKWRWLRPWLTCWLDFRTWMPAAWGIRFEAPDGNFVMETFVAGVEKHGQPSDVYLDNGKDFRMNRFAGGRRQGRSRKGHGANAGLVCEAHVKPLLEQLNITPHFAIPFNASAKVIENFFRLVSDRFDKTWHTYCGRDAIRKPERLRTSKLWNKAELFYRSGLTIESFRSAFEAWLTTDYELRECPVKASRGMCVAEAFQRLRPAGYVPQRPPSTSLMMLLMPSVPVTVRQNGIWVTAFGRHYWSDHLEDRRAASGRDLKRKVVYRFRQNDPSGIFVFDAQSGRFLCTATPYLGGGMHPLATSTDGAASAADADKLSGAIALQKRLARDSGRRLRELQKTAGNRLLSASRLAGETLGLHADPSAVPAPRTPALRISPDRDGFDAAGLAAQRHADGQAALDRRTARQFADSFFAKTGTDAADEICDPPGALPKRSAMDVLADTYARDNDHDADLEAPAPDAD